MQPIRREEVLPLGEYELVRPHFRARVIEEKKRRRARVSPILDVTFENRDTVLLQIQEMLRTERITAEDGIRHEIETYNDLLPAPGQLSMTLFVAIADKAERDRMLEAMAGLERHVHLEVGGERATAVSRERTADGYTRTTAVHYLKFEPTPGMLAGIRAGAPVALVVDHAAHAARVELPAATVQALAGDLGS